MQLMRLPRHIGKVKSMGMGAAWWNGVNKGLMANISGKIHPGAIRYYTEAGFTLTDAQL